jgi:hypothetical protein
LVRTGLAMATAYEAHRPASGSRAQGGVRSGVGWLDPTRFTHKVRFADGEWLVT